MSETPLALLPVHGGQLRQIAAQYGVAAEQLLDFSANINPDGPPSSVLLAMQRALADPAILTAYPDLDLAELKRTIADSAGVGSGNVAVANGFVPLLDAALRSLKIQRCLLPVPCFSEYRRALENADAVVVPYLFPPDNNFAYEPDAILEALLGSSCDAVLLANPQNPSGALCKIREMKRLVGLAAQHGITVLLDEAFIDYCQDDSLTPDAVELSNLIVFRSVTKFFAVPGLRVAYAVCNTAHAIGMSRYIPPWPVTSLASDAICAALRDEAYAGESRLANERRRTWLEEELERLKISTYPSSTNFLLLRFPADLDVSLLREKMIVEHQIVLRSCGNFEGLSSGHLRIAVRSEAENAKLIRGLEQTLAEMG
jgi:threonine-phosphate decarboxylase